MTDQAGNHYYFTCVPYLILQRMISKNLRDKKPRFTSKVFGKIEEQDASDRERNSSFIRRIQTRISHAKILWKSTKKVKLYFSLRTFFHLGLRWRRRDLFIPFCFVCLSVRKTWLFGLVNDTYRRRRSKRRPCTKWWIWFEHLVCRKCTLILLGPRRNRRSCRPDRNPFEIRSFYTRHFLIASFKIFPV